MSINAKNIIDLHNKIKNMKVSNRLSLALKIYLWSTTCDWYRIREVKKGNYKYNYRPFIKLITQKP